jgi:hypothetical protein
LIAHNEVRMHMCLLSWRPMRMAHVTERFYY